MGYQIFTARKSQLTTMKNNAYADMMNKWVEQEHVADQKLAEMQDKDDKLSALNDTYNTQKSNVYKLYKGIDPSTVIEGSNKIVETQRNFDVFGEGKSAGDPGAVFDSEASQQHRATRELCDGKNQKETLEELKEKYEDEKADIERSYSINYQGLTDDETKIEKKIELLETHISEYTQEMSKAEQQEAQEIKTCNPNYNGAGGGQG